jgi:hypothetical protein
MSLDEPGKAVQLRLDGLSPMSAAWLRSPRATAICGGKTVRPRIFAACAGESARLEAFADGSERSWVDGIQGALNAFGGVPQLVEPILLHSPKGPGYFVASPASLLADLATHFEFIALPPRKAAGEAAEMFARLSSMAEELAGGRAFESLDELNMELSLGPGVGSPPPGLSPLPAEPFRIARATRKVADSLHVHYMGHWYSLPYRFIGGTVSVRDDGREIQIQSMGGELICSHKKASAIRYATDSSHIPPGYETEEVILRKRRFGGSEYISWAEGTGESAAACVRLMLGRAKHEEQAYRSCGALLSLGKGRSGLLEKACRIALERGKPTFQAVKAIIEDLEGRAKA